MLFQVVDKFDTAQRGISLPNILLTPRTPINGKISRFLDKCIFKHSSLLVCCYWVCGSSSYTGLTRSHPLQAEVVLVWHSADQNQFWKSESYMGVTVQHPGGGCLGPLQLSGGTGELNTKPKLVCIVRSLYSMEIGCKSDDFQQGKK